MTPEIVGARIVEQREVARATWWLVVEIDAPEAPEVPEGFGPGHVVALYVPDPEGKWIRHPYTVSWSEGRRLAFLYRVIRGGRTTPFMSLMGAGETVRLGGRFGLPISALVPDDAPAVVCVSTGSGIGPLHGYAREALAAAHGTPGAGRPITLLAGFREAVDIPQGPALDALAASHPRFTWHPTLTRPAPGWTGRAGRVSAHLGSVATADAHWHLVGNGAMVIDVRAGLLGAGVAPERITTETYFNRGTSPDPRVVEAIVAGIGKVRGGG
ncbi:MAG: FAD-dependent oxidoreductase [Pseudomonadota bacterium]|nr:FAD-dependent oxidoreductase [Pseudomonadota bacterium]